MSPRPQPSLHDSSVPSVRSISASVSFRWRSTRQRFRTPAQRRGTARAAYWLIVPALAGSLLFPSNVGAQEGMPRAAVMGGVRVRVTYPGMRRRVGTLVSINRDTLVARWESGLTSRMALARVTEVDISMGRFPQPAHGAKVGAGIGLVGGLILSIATGRGADVTVGCAALGASVGSVVGIVRPRDTWRPWGSRDPRPGGGSDLPWRVGLVPSPIHAGTHVGLSRSF